MPLQKSPSDRKPPLAESMSRIRSRRILRSSTTSIHTSPISLKKPQFLRSSTSSIHSSPVSLMKPQIPKPLRVEESPLRPEYHSISCDFQALAKMVKDEFGNHDVGNTNFANSSFNVAPFQRGRFYDEYSARRNERLKRKKCETGEDKKTVYNLGVNVESSKRRDSKKLDGLRRSVPANFSISRSENTRYSLRSMSKENKKPTLTASAQKSVFDGERKIVTRRVHKV